MPAKQPEQKTDPHRLFKAALDGLAVVGGFSNHVSMVLAGRPATREGLISGFPIAQITPSAAGWLKNASTGTKFPSVRPHPRPQAVFRTHSACQVRNRSRTRNRLASAQVTNSLCAFLSSPR